MYHFHARGWILARDRKPLGGLPIYTWPFCPWCGGALPDTVSAVESWLTDAESSD